MKMTKYELLQTLERLERLYPSDMQWFIADENEDEGTVHICFVLDEEENTNDD
jgi:hypothetical protein